MTYFLSPYSSIGLKDFWNRWHISLSAWLRDYVYIPLGGSRKGTARKYLNIILTMFISGLWHGAGLTFIVWGLLHGIGSVVSHLIADKMNQRSEGKNDEVSLKIFDKYEVEQLPFETTPSQTATGLFVDVDEEEFNTEIEALLENIDSPPVETNENPKNQIISVLTKTVGWAVTFIYVTFTWIFFTSSSLTNALSFISSIFVSTIAEHKIFNIRLLIVIGVVLLFNFVGNKSFRLSIGFFDKIPLFIRIPVVAILTYIILQLGPETMPPFIYFSF